MDAEPLNVLFACENNAGRSVMAEALLARVGRGAFQGFSAGRNPGTQISAYAAETLQQAGYDTKDLRAKNWNEFVNPNAPRLDVVVTLDDKLKNGPFPIWFSDPVHVHWGFSDPDATSGGEGERRNAYRRLFGRLEQQMLKFAGLPLTGLNAQQLKLRLMSIAPGNA